MTEAGTGEKIVDRYILEEPLGSGGFSTVYRARHSLIGNQVAFKLLLPQHTKSQVTMERFLREAQTAASIGNPHIIKVLDCGTSSEGEMFLVMELLEGKELRKVIEEQAPLDIGWSVGVILQVLSALAAAHAAGIVHRDIKPDNIFITTAPDGSPDFVKLLDFGISKILDPSAGALTTAGEVLGTPMYMAPEQIMGSDQVDHRCDLYSVMAVLYHMLTGRTPHEAESLPMLAHMLLSETPTSVSAHNPAISPDLESIIMRGLAREPEVRWGTAQELIEALAPFSPNRGWSESNDPSVGDYSMSGMSPQSTPQPSSPGFPGADGTFPAAASSQPTGPMASIPNAAASGSYPQTYPTGDTSSPGYVSGSQPGFASGSQPGFASGSQPGFASGSQPGFASGSSPAPYQSGSLATPRKKFPLWAIFLIIGLVAVVLGGVTVTIVVVATGVFSDSNDSGSGNSSSGAGSGNISTNSGGSTGGNTAAANSLRVGQPVMGNLPFGQQLDYPLQVSQARMVTLDLQSSSFDTYLYLLQGQMQMMENDDGGDGLNSRLSMYLSPGTYTVRVGSYQNSGGGQFVLSVY